MLGAVAPAAGDRGSVFVCVVYIVVCMCACSVCLFCIYTCMYYVFVSCVNLYVCVCMRALNVARSFEYL